MSGWCPSIADSKMICCVGRTFAEKISFSAKKGKSVNTIARV
jgi:hypothetical protein